MYVDDSALEHIEKLRNEYRAKWNQEPDFSLIFSQKSITQELIVKIMERIIESGESPLAAYMEIAKPF